VNTLLIACLFAALAGNGSFSVAHAAAEKSPVPGKSKTAHAAKDPVEQEFEKLLEMDDAAQKEIDRWIKEARAFKDKGAALPEATLNAKIEQRFDQVRKAYDSFLQRNPKHVPALLAYGSFLNEMNEEREAVICWDKARELEPTDPAPWNNLANHYGHYGPVKKAFEYYERAIRLDAKEPVYLQNLGTTVYLFRHDAKEYYNINEEQVFAKALDLYRRALKLDPTNFPLATDLAQSYYGIKPLRAKEALEAWEYALKIANDDIEREGVYLHMARVELNSGRFDEARRHIGMVTNQMYNVLKARLTRNLQEKESRSKAEGSAQAAAVENAPGLTNAPDPDHQPPAKA
jgi:tetratricopeptide (TPR) repeat protein